MTQPSLANLERRARQLADAGNAPSPHTLASYERRWRQWQTFADHHSVRALPADSVHIAAFVVARLRAGVSASGISANLSAIGWYHAQLDPPVEDVTGLAKQVLRRLRGDGSDKPLSPAPVLSVGALMAMVTAPVRGVRKRAAKLVRQVSGAPPRQLVPLERDDVEFADDLSWVDLRLPALPARGRSGAQAAVDIRLDAGATLLDCPVEAMRALVAEAGDGPLFTERLVHQAHVGEWDPFEGREGTPLRLAARNRALVCVGYAGALRVEELSQARVEHLEPLRRGYRLRLPTTKTSRDGASQAVVLDATDDLLDPVRTLDRWLAIRGDHDGALFHNVHHGTEIDRGITTGEIREVLRDLAGAVGLPSTVSGHSLRRSWATHAYLRDRDALGAISLHLRHSRIDNTVRYIEDLALHLVDPAEVLSPTVIVAGPGGQPSRAKDVGFDDAPLDDLVGAALDAVRSGEVSFAPSTLRGYASFWSTWERWAESNGFDVFPADPRHVALFAAARAEEGVAPNTLRGQLRAMEAVHADNGVPTVGFVRLAAEMIAGLERGRRPPRRQAPIIPVADLERMAAWALEHAVESLESLRDYVMVCVGYAGGLRADDLHRAHLEHLEPVPAGCLLRLSASKLNQSGRRAEGVLLARRDDALDPVAAIERWKATTGLTAGPLLPVLPVTEPARPISKDAIGDRLARLAARSGCSVRPTGHSLRRSWATHAYEAGLDLLSISRQLRHRRTSMTKGYVDSLTPWRNHPADALRDTHGDA